MKNLRRGFVGTLLLVLIAVLLIGGATYVYLQNNQMPQQAITNTTFETVPPAEVMNAARNAPPELLLGGTLGNVYREYFISKQNIIGYSSTTNFLSTLEPGGWDFSIASSSYSGGTEEMLLIEFFKGTWQAVRVGANRLALELTMVEKKWPRSSGYTFALLTSNQCDTKVIIVSKDSEYNIYIPSSYPTGYLGNDLLASQLYDPYTVMKSLSKTCFAR